MKAIYCFSFSAVTLSISDRRIQGHILVTDIGHNTADALVCSYQSSFTGNKYNWYHNIDRGDQGLGTKIEQDSDSEWSITKAVNNGASKFLLMRKSSTQVIEGTLSCEVRARTEHSVVSVEIHYPSKL